MLHQSVEEFLAALMSTKPWFYYEGTAGMAIIRIPPVPFLTAPAADIMLWRVVRYTNIDEYPKREKLRT
jgi:hypothetical protein